jgi:Rieske 2Fe-2S family protein
MSALDHRPVASSLRPTRPGPDYVDPAVFTREQDRILARSWVAVALAAEIPAPGDWVTARLARENVLVVRGATGIVGAFYNVCRHRGSPVCAGPSGSAGRSLRCPYHAWTYDLDGSLVGAPQLKAMPDVDRGLHGLVPIRTEVWLGQVWCNLDDGAAPLAESIGVEVTQRLGDADMIERWGIDELVLGERRTYDVAANWKLLVENFMECYHCATIHPELTRTLPEFRAGFGTQNSASGSASFAASVEGFTLSGQRSFPLLPKLGADHDRRYWGLTLRPLTFLNLLPDHVIVHRVVPLAPDRSIVSCDWLFAADVAGAADFDPGDTVGLFDAVNRQDFVACEGCQTNMGSAAFVAGGVLVPSEHHLEAFHDWVLELLA